MGSNNDTVVFRVNFTQAHCVSVVICVELLAKLNCFLAMLDCGSSTSPSDLNESLHIDSALSAS